MIFQLGILFTVAGYCRSQQGDVIFPGYRPYRTNPVIAKGLDLPIGQDRLKGGLIFGPTDFIPNPPRDAYLPVKTSNGDTYMVPKIFYSKYNTNTNFKGNLKTPDFTNPFNLVNDFLSTGGKAVKQDDTLGGIYIPMPFGISPLAVQLMNQDDFDNGANIGLGLNNEDKFKTTPKPDLLTSALRAALQYVNNRGNPNPNPLSDQQSSFSIDQLPYPDYPTGGEETVSSKRSMLEKSAAGLSRPDFAQRLTSNLVQALFAQENPPRKDETAQNIQPANLGGFKDDKVFQKATGVYMSLPFLPSSYLGSYMNYDRTNKTNFG